jgi:hypothetical protein
MTPFESARMKALKLLALAMRGEGGEARNAQRALAAHCAKFHIDLASLSADEREIHGLAIVVKAPGWPIKPDLDLSFLAVQCLRYVCGTDKITPSDLQVGPYVEYHPTKRKGKAAPPAIYLMYATVTSAEYEDWRSCFSHYAPLWWAMKKDLLARQKIIRAALKKTVNVFVNEHQLFPPDATSSAATPTPEQMAAYAAAAASVSGDTWQRPAGRLEQPSFFLS